ncbi:MAG: GTPase HflX [Planctomycetota bacterium]
MSAPTERTDIKIQRERAVLAAVHLPESRFDPRDPLGELRALAETAGTRVVGEVTQNRDRPEAGTYMGKGKIEELKGMCEELNAGVVIFDHELSPKQIGSIEEIVGRKVLDRSELILDIFASRATTKQARLQVEIAQLEYTYPRLRAMWDHLERIVGSGGIGGVGTRGPGEQQLEIDRRIVQRRKAMLKRELEEVQARKTREVRSRNASHFTVGLVGYTNAGKSTLFNVLTEGGAYANDQLFATLLTRTREWRLSAGDARGMEVMLSDTVGFIRSLPHHLVGSFRATLEEATHADLLLLVLDVSDPNADLAYETVTDTLNDIFEDTRRIEERACFEWTPPETLLLLNKVDLLRDNASLLVWERRDPDAIPISAARPDEPWRAELEARVRQAARGTIEEWAITLPMSDGKAVHNAEQWGEVLDRAYDNGSVTLRARLGERDVARLRALSRELHAERVHAGA